MIRIWLHSGSRLVLIFTLALGVILVHPRDDDAVRAFFAATPGCTAPCFMGIRPGVTTRDQAIAVLRQHSWVRFIRASDESISWTWTGTQPAFVSGYAALQLDLDRSTVSRIKIVTAVPLGDFLSIFGMPDRQVIAVTNVTDTHGYLLLLDAFYSEHDFEIEAMASCPLKSRGDLWYSTVAITWPNQNQFISDRSSRLKNC